MRILILVAIFLELGCASFHEDSLHEVIPLRTDPERASVYSHGSYLCDTPCWANLPRESRSAVTFVKGGRKLDYAFDTHYEWEHSFFPNLIFLTLAPVGWGVDFGTGAAWRIDPPPNVISLAEAVPQTDSPSVESEPPTPSNRMIIAVAPPRAIDADQSEIAGEAAEKFLREKYPHAIVRNFRNNEELFLECDQDFNSESHDHACLAAIHLKLGATHFFLSKLTGNQIIGELRDDLSGDHQSEVIPYDLMAQTKQKSLSKFSFLPNTISIDAVSSTIETEVDGMLYVATPISGDDVFSQSFRYLGAISVSNLTPPRFGRGSQWSYNFFPLLQVVHKAFEFQTFPRWQNIEFRYDQISLGYGVEGAWKYGAHALYADLVLLYGWNDVRWEEEGPNEVEQWALSTRAEIGYRYFFSGSWHATLFSRTISYAGDVWSQVLRDEASSPGSSDSVTTVNELVGGLSVGYTWTD